MEAQAVLDNSMVRRITEQNPQYFVRLAAEHAEMKALLEIVLSRYNQPDCSGAPKPETISAIRSLLARLNKKEE